MPPVAPDKVRAEVLPRSAGGRESDDSHTHNHHHLQHGENQLKLPRALDAYIVQPGNECGGGNGYQLSVGNDKRRAHGCVIQKHERGKCPENSHDSGSDGRHRTGLSDGKPGPRIKESQPWPVGVANVNILAAGLRLHRAQFGVGHRSRHRQHATHKPRQVNQLRRPDRLHHLGRNQEDATANDRAHHDSAGLAYAQLAQ